MSYIHYDRAEADRRLGPHPDEAHDRALDLRDRFEPLSPVAPARDVYLSAALAWAWEHGFDEDELPAGSATHMECPLYLATGLLIDVDVAIDAFSEPCVKWPLSARVAEFVRRFDRGEYPELVR